LKPQKAIKKYLERYGEMELLHRPKLACKYRHVACIPACDELETLPETLTSMSLAEEAEKSLVIVVLNGRIDGSEKVHQANEQLANWLRGKARLSSDPIAEGRFQGMGLILVDRYSQGYRLPPNQGVGLARKIAADLALAWIEDGYIESPWVHSTDADVQVPKNYWRRPSRFPLGCAAVIYPFVHVPEGDALQRRALACYDAFLRQYVDGLQQAGSPYAFQTIGSLICFRHDAYARVRGIPKRQAGEDFYLLNKLAKVGRVETLTGDPIRLSGRTSGRVPFGTGMAIGKIRDHLIKGIPYEVYDPRIFTALKYWLDALALAAKSGKFDDLRQALEDAPKPFGPVLRQAIDSLGYLEPVKAAIAAVQGKVLHKRLHDWHDGFRTLKLIHALRDEGLGTRALDPTMESDLSPQAH